jgi:hypothetical protein
MKGKAYSYIGNCQHLPSRLISEMVDQERTILWSAFRKWVSPVELRRIEQSLGYTHDSLPRHLHDDYAVSFHRSKYNGVPCVFFDWSSIEYVFVEQGQRTITETSKP